MVTAAESHQAAADGLLLFTALGPPLIAVGWSGWRRDRAHHAAASRWAMGEARIEQAEIVERRNPSARSREGASIYDPFVIDSFRVDGAEQRGARPFLGQKPDWTRREWVRRHPPRGNQA